MDTIDHMRVALLKGKEMRALQRWFFRGEKEVVAQAKRCERQFDDLLTFALNMDAAKPTEAGDGNQK